MPDHYSPHRRAVRALCLPLALLIIGGPAAAQERPAAFHPGPLIPEYGPIADVATSFAVEPGTEFAIAFDTATPAKAGERNRTLESAARFLNMHAAAGMSPEAMRLAVVIHGQASIDLLTDTAYAPRRENATNPNLGLIEALADKGVRVILCGQSMMALGIEPKQLSNRVEVALSAMTAHAVLQQQGYTLNPF